MANEAVIIELFRGDGGCPVRYTVANEVDILKGTLMKINDPRTAVKTSEAADPFCGIAAADKVANDGATFLACYTHGIFDLFADQTITVGSRIAISNANKIGAVTSDELIKSNVGIALETASENEVIAVLIGSGF